MCASHDSDTYEHYKAPPPPKKESCIGVTRPTLKIPPTLEVFFIIAPFS